jgi:hypothetical protein
MEVKFFEPGNRVNACVWRIPEDATERTFVEMRHLQETEFNRTKYEFITDDTFMEMPTDYRHYFAGYSTATH